MAAPKKTESVHVVKVSAFPIAAEFERSALGPAQPTKPNDKPAGKSEPSASKNMTQTKCRIKAMNQHGLIMEADYDFYRVGEVLTANFELPVLKVVMKPRVQVVRTQQPIEHARKGEMATRLIVEMRFLKMSPEESKALAEFLTKIGQKQTNKSA